MAERFLKRLPAIERRISEINPKVDVRVRIVGTVLGNSDNTIVIDDGSGKTEIYFNSPVDYIKCGQTIRVMTRIMPLIDGFECRGECIQNLESFDVSLYKDVMKIISR